MTINLDGAAPRLKSLDLQGYKTFATKTEIALSSTITAVVGPNGTGKSNIADAIRWVLGEQSYRLLRGKRTEDMIFSGSETRPRASMAQATITFDNSDGWLPIDFTEVSIGRRAYRDGQNEYLLNGQKVRLRDVTELLASCGLAQRTYTIIGQGLVDAALSLKVDERRQLFEEAAGIGLYRTRREEAIRRLDTTRRNLERVQDILAEIKPRLRSLKRQAARAGEYLQVKRDLNAVLREWYGYHWYHLLNVLAMTQAEAESKSGIRDELRRQVTSAERELTVVQNRIDDFRSQLHAWSRQVSEFYEERETLGRKLVVSQERSRWLTEQEALIQSEISTLNQEKVALEQRLALADEVIERKRQEFEGAEAAFNHSKLEGAGVSQRQAHLNQAHEVRKSLENLAADQAAWKARKAQGLERLRALSDRHREIQSAVEDAENDLARARQTAEATNAEREEAERAYHQAQEDDKSTRQRLHRAESELAQWEKDLTDLRSQRASLSGRLQVFRERADAVMRVNAGLRAANQAGELKGLSGRLDEHLKISPKHKPAIMAALGEFGEGLAFQTLEDILAAVAWLQGHEGGEQAALLPLTTLQLTSIVEPPSDPECVGNAAQLVGAPERYRPLVELLLGQILVVTDGIAAQRLLPDLPPDARVVTLNGDMFFPTGQVLIGRWASHQSSAEALEHVEASLDTTAGSLAEVEAKKDQLMTVVEAAKTRLEETQLAVEQARGRQQETRLRAEQNEITTQTAENQLDRLLVQQRDVESELSKAEEEHRKLEGDDETFEADRVRLEEALQAALTAAERAEPDVEMALIGTRLEIAEKAVQEEGDRKAELADRSARLDIDRDAWTKRLESTLEEQAEMRVQAEEAQTSVESVESRLAELSAQINQGEGSLAEAEDERSELRIKQSQMRSDLQSVERQHSQAQIELARRQEEMISLRRRIEDDFGLVALDHIPGTIEQEPLPLEGLVERLPRIEQLPSELESQVNRLRAQLRRMGAVNPEAHREYEEVRQRTEFLTTQMDDLRSAETQIQEIIAELDLLMEREFRKTFDAVAVSFRKAFTRLFGGGSARLVLTDPKDLNQTGIDIETRLPGRREQGLAVLSGGERSLVACALIFALLEVSPTPFCVLDEVDAMLDEANVLRFCEMLHELSRETQFIVITHNRLTVQEAEVVYGVSMGADSISRVISLKLEEAEKAIAS